MNKLKYNRFCRVISRILLPFFAVSLLFGILLTAFITYLGIFQNSLEEVLRENYKSAQYLIAQDYYDYHYRIYTDKIWHRQGNVYLRFSEQYLSNDALASDILLKSAPDPYEMSLESESFYTFYSDPDRGINAGLSHTPFYTGEKSTSYKASTEHSYWNSSLAWIPALLYKPSQHLDSSGQPLAQITDDFDEEDESNDSKFDNATRTAYVTTAVAEHVKVSEGDLVGTEKLWLTRFYNNRFSIVLCTVISLLGFIFCLWITIISAGYTKRGEEVDISFWHKIPYAFLVLALFLAETFLAENAAYELQSIFNSYSGGAFRHCIFLATLLFYGAVIAEVFLANTMHRIHAHVFKEYLFLFTLQRWGIRMKGKFMKLFRFFMANTSYSVKSVLFILGFLWLHVLFPAFLFEAFYSFRAGRGIFLYFFVLICADIAFLGFTFRQWYFLQQGVKNIAEGNLSYQLDTKKLKSTFKHHAGYLNRIGTGMQLAVEKQMRSERFKTELITNVSHDIKTPLTSIINYVDLLQKEGITDEEREEYIGVLRRQSQRLKTLIENLIEASKASSGSLSVEWSDCDLGILLTQVVGEFEERCEKNNLTLVVRSSDEPAVIQADHRHLWRIFDNLMNNICKYSLAGTRVYIDETAENGTVQIIFRNTSKDALNISSEELMERFVRGDSSRNTEGNGLGLSITKSLVELMNGTFALDIDGDLFKVTIAFPVNGQLS